MRKHLSSLLIGALAAVAVTMSSPTVAQSVVRIFGTRSGSPIALTAAADGSLNVTVTGGSFAVPILAPDGSAAAPSYSFASFTGSGMFRNVQSTGPVLVSNGSPFLGSDSNSGARAVVTSLGWTATGNLGTAGTPAADLMLERDAANTLAQRNGTNAQTARLYGYLSGARATYTGFTCTTEAVTLTGATTATTNFIPAGAVVEAVATTTTTTITNASGYQVGEAGDADRWGDKTGTAVGTNTGSTDYTAEPRWWTNAARGIILTAKTADFTGGVVQVMACYRTATGT